ncbi:MAG: homoserine kinase, partial [Alkaliphilus sp.]|nr:homoserine kinase [Alkaliphilus sp.]
MIKITVPATTANMGPGFDCLGMALNLYTNVIFEEIERGLIIKGCHPEYQNENNLIYQSMLKIFERAEYSPNGIKITIDSNIPVSRGLGSSAACILAGIMGANEMADA